jgi:hypothetical protein
MNRTARTVSPYGWTPRLVAAGLAMALTFAMAAVLTTGIAGTRSPAQAAVHRHSSSSHALTARQAAFQDTMRKLWEDHVTWTRLAIVTFADGSKGFDATAGRLLQNQTDIGNAFIPFYGARAGHRLTALLNDHITIAVELLQAAKAGDTAAFEDARVRWYANSDDISDHLSSLNRKSWPRAVVRAMMRTHLDQTLTEAADELGGDYTGSVAVYEQIHLHILQMADTLSSGIIRQFPRRFR